MHLVCGISSRYFFIINFFHFFDFLFPGQITIRIDTWWAQLLLELSMDYFETVHTCPTRSVDVHVVVLLSSVFFITFFFLLFRLSFLFFFLFFFFFFFQVQLLLE